MSALTTRKSSTQDKLHLHKLSCPSSYSVSRCLFSSSYNVCLLLLMLSSQVLQEVSHLHYVQSINVLINARCNEVFVIYMIEIMEGVA